jgi:hypothetical protein
MRFQSLVPSQLTSFHTQELSSTTPLVPPGGAVLDREGSNEFLASGKAPWQLLFLAVPQPRLLPHHNIAGIEEGRQTNAGPPTSTRESGEERGTIVLAPQLSAIEDRCSARCKGAGRGAENKVPSTYGGNV